jgi:hypothetical protein
MAGQAASRQQQLAIANSAARVASNRTHLQLAVQRPQGVVIGVLQQLQQQKIMQTSVDW